MKKSKVVDHVACGVSWLQRQCRANGIQVTVLALLLPVMGAVSGCGTMEMRAGRMPGIPALTTSLIPGESTERNVLDAIGRPAGRGRSMLPWQETARDVWTYYYEEGRIDLGGGGDNDDRRLFLFVFFNHGRYDGYLWFSSLRQ